VSLAEAAWSGCSASRDASRAQTFDVSTRARWPARRTSGRNAPPRRQQHRTGAAHAVLAPACVPVSPSSWRRKSRGAAAAPPRAHGHAVDRADSVILRSATLRPWPGAQQATEFHYAASEALAKLTGRERYVDDIPLDGFLWGMTVRSPRRAAASPRSGSARTSTGPSSSWWDHRDIPGPNVVALIERISRCSRPATCGTCTSRCCSSLTRRARRCGARALRSKSWSRPSCRPRLPRPARPGPNPIRQRQRHQHLKIEKRSGARACRGPGGRLRDV